MFSPADLIEALRRRQRLSIRPLPQAEGPPPSWTAWLAAKARQLAVAPASAASVIAAAASRPPRPRPAAEELHGWQALRALWRQQWDPPGRDERGLRAIARTTSILLHLLFLVIMSWLMHARFMLAQTADAQRGEHVIQVEFIGEGTDGEEGGGTPADAEPTTTAAESRPSPGPELPSPTPGTTAPAPVAASGPEPEPPPQPQVVEQQPLEVTETPTPDGPFLVPPVQDIELAPPSIREVEVVPRERGIELAETPDTMMPEVRPLEVPLRQSAQPQRDVTEREIAMRPETLPIPEVRTPALQAPTIEAQSRAARERDIPMPTSEDATADAGAAEEDPAGQAPSLADEAPSARRDAEQDPGGAGPARDIAEGAWATPRRGTDLGTSDRERQGGQGGTSSLFNPDGSVRLPPGTGQVGGGLPPGTITEDYDRIDRMGTWLKRPPTDYEPTRFDRFWIPHESLLEEWVRRSIRTVLIPIPGTNKTIRCNVATLALAGGCDLVDPNLQDQPAGARPPPDVPFRPELHEDQEGLSDDVWR